MLGFSALSQDALATSGLVVINIAFTLPSVAATGQVGNVDGTGDTSIDVDGVGSNGLTNAVTPQIDVLIPLAGWGAGSWGAGSWGTQVILPQGTTAVGSGITFVTDQSFTVGGVQGTGQAGTGLTVDTGVGNVVTLSGVAATGQVEEVEVIEGQGISFTLPSVQANTAVGDVSITVTTDITVTLSGVAATGQVGNGFSLIGDSNLTLFGLEGTTAVNKIEIISTASINLLGISSSTFVGNVLVWGNVVPVPGNTWTEIVPDPTNSWGSSTPNPGNTWTGTTPNPSNTWTEIVPNPNTNWDDAA